MAPKRGPGAPASATGTRINSNSNSRRFNPLGGREQAAAQAVVWGDKPALQGMVLRTFRPLTKGKLRGFATVELACGLVLIDLPVFIGRDAWAALPRKPVLDTERCQRLDANGQPKFQPVASWRSRNLGDEFSRRVIELVRAAHPDVLEGVGR